MGRYEVYLFIHIVAAIVWLGSGLMLSVLAFRATRPRDERAMGRLAADAAALGPTYFMPAGLVVLVFGILMVVDGPWNFDQLWIVLGLLGFAATFLTGALIVKPRSEKIDAMIKRDGGEVSPATATEIEKLLTLGRGDLVVLYLVVADMALKPTGDQVGLLAAMAAILVVGVGYVIMRTRAIHVPAVASGEAMPAGTAMRSTDG